MEISDEVLDLPSASCYTASRSAAEPLSESAQCLLEMVLASMARMAMPPTIGDVHRLAVLLPVYRTLMVLGFTYVVSLTRT